MVHIYRQITTLSRVRPVVIARKREETERFPFDPVIVLPKPALRFFRRIWYKNIRSAPWQISAGEAAQLAQILDRANASLLHIYFGHIAVQLFPLLRDWPKPTVVSFHGADAMVDLEKPEHRAATKKMLDAVRLVLVRSESLARALVKLGAAESKIRIQRTGIPLEEVPFREREWPADGKWKFLQACRLVRKKGLHTSLQAFANFAARYPLANFTIAGEGPERNELELQAKRLGIASKVRFEGFVSQSDLREIFYQSHVFLHPSTTGTDGNQEGVPNSMLEAMASGLPVFATRHGGIPEAIEQRVSGLLVPEGDANALTRELLQAVLRPDELSSWAKRGSESVAQKFEQKAQVQKLEDYYFEALKS